ncbi:putative ribonuclease H-like domain-containing protein [Tanacetum coccineum]
MVQMKLLERSLRKKLKGFVILAGASEYQSNTVYNGAMADFTNLETTVNVSPIPTSRIHSIHLTTQILRDPTSAIEPKKISQALEDESWVDAMQEELLEFKIQKVWILVDWPFGKKEIGIKWVYRNKKDERGVVVRNKARLVAQGYRQEEGIDYDEVFAPMARTEAIRIILAFAYYMGFIVYQMDMKSAFLYGTIDKKVYVSQPPGFVDPKFPKKTGYIRGTIDKTLFIKKDKNDIMLVQVYVDDIIFGSTKRSWCDEFEALMKSRFQMSSMGELTFFLRLQVKQKEDGIFISQDKYVAEILKKFDFASVKTASTPIETQKSLTKDEEAADVDVHLYRSMIGSLMYLTASRPDIMFAVCACSRFQVTPKTSHLNAVKRIFSDYAGATLDRKSTTGGCQFLGKRLISWQCKKQTIVATSTTKEKYVVAANCYGQVLWIQNQMLDYGLKKFDFASVKTVSTPIETQKLLVKDEEATDVDVHLYRSMIGSLMYLTAFRPDIMFAVCACSRFQVTSKTSHLNAVNRIFRYLKGKPKLGLWYPRVSSFGLEAYSDSDYAGANLDRKSTTGGCQFLGRRLISWQCKKQTVDPTP